MEQLVVGMQGLMMDGREVQILSRWVPGTDGVPEGETREQYVHCIRYMESDQEVLYAMSIPWVGFTVKGEGTQPEEVGIHTMSEEELLDLLD